MRKLMLLALASLVAAASTAAARESTTGMSCAQAAAVVASEGAIVLTTGEHTYDRFVAHVGFCQHGEQAVPVVAPTLDSEYCSVGYRCEYRQRLFDDFGD